MLSKTCKIVTWINQEKQTGSWNWGVFSCQSRKIYVSGNFFDSKTVNYQKLQTDKDVMKVTVDP